mmetsp:Transcript_27720/g.94617  ORF Transcript_27720/g.94617 Transcript_27720/m.94617 type:complete len:207 (-) Transcript_27720:67-687(-)
MAAAACSRSRMARCCSRGAPRRGESSASASLGLKSPAGRSTASAPHRDTQSRSLRPSGVGFASLGSATSLAPTCTSSASSAPNCPSSANSSAPSSRLAVTAYAAPTTVCPSLLATRTATTAGASAPACSPAPCENSSSSNAPSLPGEAAFLSFHPAERSSPHSSTVCWALSSSSSRSTLSNMALFSVTPARVSVPRVRYRTTDVVR